MESQKTSTGERNFSHIQLGNARRAKRLVKLVDLMCRRSGGTLPQNLDTSRDLRAFYRLMNCTEVTHEAILSAHRDVLLRTKVTVSLCSDEALLPVCGLRSLGAMLGPQYSKDLQRSRLVFDTQRTPQLAHLCEMCKTPIDNLRSQT